MAKNFIIASYLILCFIIGLWYGILHESSKKYCTLKIGDIVWSCPKDTQVTIKGITISRNAFGGTDIFGTGEGSYIEFK